MVRFVWISEKWPFFIFMYVSVPEAWNCVKPIDLSHDRFTMSNNPNYLIQRGHGNGLLPHGTGFCYKHNNNVIIINKLFFNFCMYLTIQSSVLQF